MAQRAAVKAKMTAKKPTTKAKSKEKPKPKSKRAGRYAELPAGLMSSSFNEKALAIAMLISSISDHDRDHNPSMLATAALAMILGVHSNTQADYTAKVEKASRLLHTAPDNVIPPYPHHDLPLH